MSTSTYPLFVQLVIERYDHLQLPNDPYILLSYVNTKLRDNYSSLNKLCAGLEINRDEIEKKLLSINYIYNRQLNRFVLKD